MAPIPIPARPLPPSSPSRPLRPFRQYKTNPSWEAIRPLEGKVLDRPPAPFKRARRHATKASTNGGVGGGVDGGSSHGINGVDGATDGAAFDSGTVGTSQHDDYPTIHLSTLLVPVSYASVLTLVPTLHQPSPASPSYDLIIHVGVGSPGSLKLEQRGRRFGYEKEGKEDKDGRLGGGYEGEEWDNVVQWGHDGVEEVGTAVKGKKVVEWMRKWGVAEGEVTTSEDAGLYLCEFINFASLGWAQRVARSSESSTATPVQFLHVPPVGTPFSVDELTALVQGVVWAVATQGLETSK
ncbi:hypothetical protein MNV49_001107 [Pseudohyphozyma bogoriensis]|nr:hypothetical protein MNV49_001107 [Pseudohyphozyma bogoriensis]